ncbi:MAG: phenylalanine--tRNA ligase subunit beta [Azospirillaceae bacterium]
MKLTLGWLKEHLETDADLDTICRALTALGLEVDGVEDRGAALAPFVVARVLSAEKHPNADKLKVCTVDPGTGGSVQVVCGAPNARAGMTGVFAPPGAYIPGTGTTLSKGVIRGVESAGMLVSEREMGLSDEHEGIIDLERFDGGVEAAPGTPFADILRLNDPVIEIGLTPDRGDCAGVRGIARDLAAAGIGTLKPLDAAPVPGAFESPTKVRFDFPAGEEHACPLFLGRTIRGIRNGPSPRWLQDRLRAIGLRPISTLVDITNFSTFDRNRPLHVFDADTLAGDLRLSLSTGGERLEALNDKDYTLPEGVCVIADDDTIVSLGGVIGGVGTGCTEETTTVFLEAALFDPVRTASTGRRQQIDSDARYRFERGLDPAAVFDGIEQATRMILELCGGEPSELTVAGAPPEGRRTIALRPTRVAHLGGLEVPVAEQARILAALGCDVVEDRSGHLAVMTPSWRGDLQGEADLVEEVLRVRGYDAIEAVPLPRPAAITRPAFSSRQRAVAAVKRVLAERGMDEAVTWSFMDSPTAARFGLQDDGLKLVNPIASDLDAMRPSILPNLLRAAGRNTDRGLPDAALFEVGPGWTHARPDGQRSVAAGVRVGETGPRHWAAAPRPVDAFDAKADALAALAVAGAPVDRLQVTTDAPDWYHPGRSGCLRLGPTVLAHFGEAHPAILDALDVDGPAAVFEVFLETVPEPKKKKGTARPMLTLSPFQPVERDFAFVVDESVPADTIVRAVRGAERALIADVAVFDVYRGKGVEEGSKSVALAVTLQPMEATLTDPEIEAVAKKIVAGVEKQTGGRLRG